MATALHLQRLLLTSPADSGRSRMRVQNTRMALQCCVTSSFKVLFTPSWHRGPGYAANWIRLIKCQTSSAMPRLFSFLNHLTCETEDQPDSNSNLVQGKTNTSWKNDYKSKWVDRIYLFIYVYIFSSWPGVHRVYLRTRTSGVQRQ